MKKALLLLVLLLGAPSAVAQDDVIRFAFVADNHFSVGAPSVADIRACVDDINTLGNLDFVVMGGDITDFGSDDELTAVKLEFDRLRYPYYVVAGNHDAKWSESGCNTFKNVFGYEQFEFETRGWRFLGTGCGPDMRMAPALLPRESMVWLESRTPGRKTIFFNHYPQDTSVLNYFDVTRTLKKIGVRHAIGGHWHQNRVLNYGGIPAILGRSALSAGRVPGYNLVEIHNDRMTVSERRVFPHTTVQLEPWYRCELAPVEETVAYDAHGLPPDFPWLRYEVNEAYPAVRDIWQFQDDANIVAGFAMQDGKAWYTTSSGLVRCISLQDGKRLWTQSFPGKIFSTPALSGRTLVFGCTDGKVYAVDSRSGKTLWTAAADKSVLGSPVIFDGKVFIGASDGCFRCLDLRSGKPVWTFRGVEGFIECRAWVDAEQVVFGAWAGKLYSLDTRTGALQWTWRCARPGRMFSPAAVWPVKAAGRIFIAVPDRRVYAIDARTGRECFWVSGGREAIGLSEDGTQVLAKSMFHRAYAFRADVACDGPELPVSLQTWNVEDRTGYEIGPTPLVERNGIVLIPTDKGNLLAFSMRDGSFLWAHKYSIALINPMQVWNEGGEMHILASTMDGVVTHSVVAL